MADVKLRIALDNSGNSYLDVDKNNGLKLIESLSQSSGKAKEVFYGSIANSGNAEIIDVDGNILRMLEEGTLNNSNVPVQLFVNGNLIQKHITNDSEYNSNTKNFTISMTNNLSIWDVLVYRGRPLTDGVESAYSIVVEIMLSLGYSLEQIDNRMLSRQLVYGNVNSFGTVKDYLELIKIQYPYLSNATYRQTIDKICQIAQLQVYADNEGIPVFVTGRPIIDAQMLQNAILIPKSYMENNLEKSVILKNKYDGVDIDEVLVSKSVVPESNCGSASSSDTKYETESDAALVGVVKGDKTYDMTLKLYFKPFVATIPAKTNLNLNTAYNIKKFTSLSNVGNNLLIENISTYNYYIQDLQETISISPEIVNEHASVPSMLQEKITNVKYNESDDTFTINFVACVGRDCSTVIPVYAEEDIVLEQQSYRAQSIVFTFYGDQLQFKFDNIDTSSPDIETSKTIVSLKSNELLQSSTKINNVKISTQIKDNIFSDYSNGISTATINLFCGDLYYSDGGIAKNWANGEIINVGDIIYFQHDKYYSGSQRYWKVVGRRVSKRGVPRLSLTLEEVRVAEERFSFSFRVDNLKETLPDLNVYADIYINGQKKLIEEIGSVKRGDILKIVRKEAVSLKDPNRYYLLTTIRIGDYDLKSGEEYIIDGDTHVLGLAWYYDN